jgi:hypothetical protein
MIQMENKWHTRGLEVQEKTKIKSGLYSMSSISVKLDKEGTPKTHTIETDKYRHNVRTNG